MMATVSVTLGAYSTMAERVSVGASTSLPDQALPEVQAESSFALVNRAHAGDAAARDELCARYLPRLQRWAHGRLPASARGALDTVDLVQDTFMQVLQRLGEFQPRHEGAFQSYLRTTLMRRIVDEIRRVQRRGPAEPLDIEAPGHEPSPLQEAIGTETLERYEAALSRLAASDREAIIMRIEMGCGYAEIMSALEKPSLAATQMTVSRALVRLAKEMSHERE